MANPHKGEVAFDSGGQHYKLSFSANALVELEEALDRDLEDIIKTFAPAAEGETRRPPRLRDLRIMFWAALLDHQPDTTMDDAKRILSGLPGTEMGRLVGEALLLALPQSEASGAARPQMPDQDGTGPASSTPSSTPAAPKRNSGERRLAS